MKAKVVQRSEVQSTSHSGESFDWLIRRFQQLLNGRAPNQRPRATWGKRQFVGVEPLEPREMLATDIALVAGDGVPLDLPAVTRTTNSADVVDQTQSILFDPATRTERVFATDAGAGDGADGLLREAGFTGLADVLVSLGTPDDVGVGAPADALAAKILSGFDLPEIVTVPETVHGNDDRVQVNNTTQFPWSTVGRLAITFPSGASGHCSGAMIGAYHFLTAGHCVHDAGEGGWASQLLVSAAQDGTEKFYGTADWQYVRSYTGWTQDQSPDHDWALITLDRRLGNFTGWLGREWRGDLSDYNGMTVNTAGFPGDLGGTDMYFATGPTDHATEYRVYYSGHSGMDTAGGQSGSSVWRYDGSSRYVNAIHAYGGSTLNSGTRINEDKFDRIGTWIADDDTNRPPTDRPDLVDYDQHFGTSFAYFSPTTVSSGQQFTARSVARNNGTAAAGAFTVSFYASTNTFISTGDYFIGNFQASSLNPFIFIDQTTFTGAFPSNIPAGNYYVGWIIDSGGTQTEFDESNNTGVITGSQLTVTSTADDHGNNAASSTAVGDPSTTAGNLEVGTDVDWFNFPTVAGHTYVFETTLNSLANSTLTLYDTNGTSVLDFDDDGGTGLASRIDWTAPANGTYYLKVDNFSDSQTGTYTLHVTGTDPSTAEIHGTKWNDLDGDGIRDAGEPGLPGWTIYLDLNGDGTHQPSTEPSQVTDASGDYSFLNLAAGTYVVGEVMQSGWDQTFPGTESSAALAARATGDVVVATTASDAPIYLAGEATQANDSGFLPETNVSSPLINLDQFRADPRFAGIDGSGFATAILDTGIDLDDPFWGPDSAAPFGVADRIVYQEDFADGDLDATDVGGHGTNVTSIAVSQDATYTGMAPGSDIIALKVFTDGGSGNFSMIEDALQWVVQNATTYNIASVNMSLGDSGNFGSPQTLYGVADEMAALAAMDVIVVSASGNDFFGHGSAQGVSYPAADPNSLSVGAVWDANNGGPFNWSSGAIDHTTGADRLTSFSQRHNTMTDILAPGAQIMGAGPSASLTNYSGTSQASPHIAGIATLSQQLATQHLGRRLTPAEMRQLLRDSAVTVNDGDDENDNVVNTGLDFPRVDVFALGEAILAMGGPGIPGTHSVVLSPGEVVTGIDFGNQATIACNLLVTNVNDSGSGSLRAAIDAANSNPGTDKICFDVPGSGPHTISPLSPLPPLREPTLIDGTSEPDFAGTPVIELNGASAGALAKGLRIAGGDSIIQGLAINRFNGAGMFIEAGGDNVIAGNFIGTDVTGTIDLGNAQHGLFVFNSSNNTIGGVSASARNVISGNTINGVSLVQSGSGTTTGNLLQGNRIGTDVSGTADLGNGFHGVRLFASSGNTIGGTAAGAGNVISGNGHSGVTFVGSSTNNYVQGNRIGTDAAGSTQLGNAQEGVYLLDSSNNTVGGAAVGAGNVISRNGKSGVRMEGGANSNLVAGNLIGTNAAGTLNLGNTQHGVFVLNSSSNEIGGNVSGAGNVISANGLNGVSIVQAGGVSTGNVVSGNSIGLNTTGTAALGNVFHGVRLYAVDNNTIGGTTASARNLISDNGQAGVKFEAGANDNVIQGNRIGTDVSGTLDRGNGRDGVWMEGSSTNTVGGTAAGAGNLISGNGRNGILSSFNADGNIIQGNTIGTDAAGTSALGNFRGGVSLFQVSNTTVGGTAAGAGNIVGHSGVEAGVEVRGGTSTGNAIRQNSIFENRTLGIEIGIAGVDPNDLNDPDIGPNQKQNYPVISSVVLTAGNLEITYSVPTTSGNALFPLAIEFFITDGISRSGKTFLGSHTYTEGASPTITIPSGGATAGVLISATATDGNGNTSEFSNPGMVSLSSLTTAPAVQALNAPIRVAELRPIAAAATTIRRDTGLTSEQFVSLRDVGVQIGDLSGNRLGLGTSNTIVIDSNATSHSSFVDRAPFDEMEFTKTDADALGQTDLFTTVLDEIGHLLGLADLLVGHEDDLMFAALARGS